MKILVINGVNLNLLGLREKNLYGDKSYRDLVRFIRLSAKKEGLKVKCVQSNYEGKIVEYIQKAYRKYDGILLNAGAYTHTSIAILDALKAVQLPTVEVHLTDIAHREDFRRTSFVSLYAFACIQGKGFDGYREGLSLLKAKLSSALPPTRQV